MSIRTLVTVAAVVWAIAVLVSVFVGLPTLLTISGVNVNFSLIVNALAALGSVSAAVVALWIATSDRRDRQKEREEADRKQAGLVRIKARWQSLGYDQDESVRVAPYIQVGINNFGTLPIVDVQLTRWEWEGHEARFVMKPPYEPPAAVLPSFRSTAGDRAEWMEFVPTDDVTKTAMAAPTITRNTDLTVTVEFTDAGEKRWRRSNKGLLEQV